MSVTLAKQPAAGLPRPVDLPPIAVSELALTAGAALSDPGQGKVLVSGVTHSARQVLPGDLFAALPGLRAHGASYAGDALARGAVAVLTDHVGAHTIAQHHTDVPVLITENPRDVLGYVAAKIYANPSAKLALWGVTGTAGKTTTAHFIDSALRAAGLRTGLFGNIGIQFDGQRFATSLNNPEAPDLQALLAVMAQQRASDVVMEVTSHGLRMGRVTGTQFAIAAFTNLSQDHLDFHSDMEDYFQAKARLFDGRAAMEVVCVDDSWGQRLASQHARNPITVSAQGNPDATWTATQVMSSPTGEQSFVAVGPAGIRLSIQLHMPGFFNIANALVAIGCLHQREIDLDAIQEGIARAQVPGRMQRIDLGQSFTAVVDYSHKPAAVELSLYALRAQTQGRVVVVLGCGGDRDQAKRPLMGEAAARRSAVLVITDDNPRSEDPAAIRAAMRQGALAVPAAQRGEVVEIGDRRQAIEHAVSVAQPGDLVVVAGKGHETGQEIAGVIHPFSDVDVLTAAIRSILA